MVMMMVVIVVAVRAVHMAVPVVVPVIMIVVMIAVGTVHMAVIVRRLGRIGHESHLETWSFALLTTARPAGKTPVVERDGKPCYSDGLRVAAAPGLA